MLLVCDYEERAGAAERFGVPSLSQVSTGFDTPRELIVQLLDDRDPLFALEFLPTNRRWRLRSAERFAEPMPGAHPLRRPLERTWILRFAADIPLSGAADDYRAAGAVWAEPNHLYPTLAKPDPSSITPNDPQYAEQWNLPLIGMPAAWAIEKGGPNGVIAVIDTGAALTHPDLRSQLWTNPGEVPDNGIDDDGNGFIDDIHGWDFVDAVNAGGKGDFGKRDADPSDETGHGTHVSGIVGAKPDNGIDVAGVAWNCPLMVIRSGFAARDGGTFLQEDDSAAGILYAVENGARVINMSWGDERGSFLLRDVIRYAASQDVVLVGATGNDSRAAIVYPAAFPEVIAVAASDQNDDAAYFTNARTGVDIAAPGIVILSLDIGDGLRTLSGTSMASPHVAGVAALMRSRRPNLTAAEVRTILRATTTALNHAGKADGVGRLDARRALIASESLTASIAADASFLGADRRLELRGTAAGPAFSHYLIHIGESITPASWNQVYESRSVPVVDSTLWTWDTSQIAEGEYSLRLEVFDTSGNIARDQVPLVVDHSLPRLLRHGVVQALANAQAVALLEVEADDPIAGQVVFDRLDGAERLGPMGFGIAERRYMIVLADYLTPGKWRYRIEASNRVGMSVTATGDLDYSPNPPNPNARASLGTRRLSAMDVARRSADFDGDGMPEFIGGTPNNAGFRATQVYQVEPDGRIRAVHFFRSPFTPQDIGDTDNDGLVEVLGESDGNLVLLEAAAPRAYPSVETWRGTDLRHGQFADVDGDGIEEIVARRGSARIVVYRAVGDNRDAELAVLDNPTKGTNLLTETVAVGDIDGDDLPEILVGDADGEIVAFGMVGGTLAHRWSAQTPYREIRAITAAMVGDTRWLAILATEALDPAGKTGRFLSVSLHRWDRTLGLLVAAQPAESWKMRLLADDEEPRLLTAGMTAGSEPEIIVVAGGGLYALSASDDGLALAWAAPALNTVPAALDLTGDGADELLFTSQGLLSIVTGEPGSGAATRPYGLTIRPLDSRRVRLEWQIDTPVGSAEILRTANGGTRTRIATVANGTSFDDDSVSPGNRYAYEVETEGGRSDSVAVLVSEQPELLSAEALAPDRIAVSFSLAMGASAREPASYRVAGIAGRSQVPSSAISYGNAGTRVVLLLDGALASGTHRVEIVAPERVLSVEGMPVDASRVVADIIVEPANGSVTDLRAVRVYPNPVVPARSHAARVTVDGLPPGAQVRVYDAAGSQVAEGVADGTSRWVWHLRNTSSAPVAGGVYTYAIDWRGDRVIGKVAVIR